MEKKKTKTKPASEPRKASEDKPKKKTAKTSSPAKKTPKDAAKKSETSVRLHEAAKRTVQEAGSIAPPTGNLVSAFSLFKSSRPTSRTPTVTRVAPGGTLPKPPAPPATAKPAAQNLVSTPTPAPAAAPPAKSAAPAAAPAPALPKPPVKPAAAPVPPMSTSSPAPARPAPASPAPAQRPSGPAQFRPKPPARPPEKRRPVEASKPPPAAETTPAKPALKKIQVSTQITVRELSEKMEVKSSDLIRKLISLGIFATINQRLETEAATIIAHEFGFDLEVLSMYKEEELQIKAVQNEAPETLKPRSPVVTVMGHVDHGKTSLLDAIRETKVAEGESGGITQHIGAYRVKTPKGDIVFLDTPGHQAFTAMRARGAKITDIVVLVVSATDGVMPQTVEAIDHAKAAGVPIIVAVNKIDLPGANPQKMRQELSQYGLLSEEWGGKNIFVDVSAKKRMNIPLLLDMCSLQAEMMELKSNPDRPGYGVILEAKMDPKRGSLATLLVQAGTVKVGDAFVAGLSYGKIKALVDDTGKRLELAGPSTPVEVLGITGLPQAGDVFSVVSDDKQARDIAEKRRLIHREQSIAHQRHMSLVGLRSQLTGAVVAKDLNLLIKADVQGSLQALKDSLEPMSTSECRVRIIHSGLGNANESDVLLASASDAVTLLFHTSIEPRAKELADREGVEIRSYEIIYELIADVKAALEGLLEPEIVDVTSGKAEVREIFNVKNNRIAGLFVREGKVVRGGFVRVLRAGQSVFEGRVSGLKRFKDDVKEVDKGLECGASIEGFKDIQKGDELEFFVKESRTRRLKESGNPS